MPNETKSAAVRTVKSAERVLDLLEAVGASADGATFVRLSSELGIPKSSLHGLLEVLRNREYLELDIKSRTYKLGVRIWETGFAFQSQHDALKVAQQVLQFIAAEVNETAQYAKLVGSENVYLAKVDSTHALRLQSDVGTRLSAHATGIGKAILSRLSDDDVRSRFQSEKLEIFTPNTLPTISALLRDLEITRQRGFSIDNEEYTAGVFCIAVPVFDRTGSASTAISVSVPITRATPSGLARILATLAEASVKLSMSTGCNEPQHQLKLLSDPVNAALKISEYVPDKFAKI